MISPTYFTPVGNYLAYCANPKLAPITAFVTFTPVSIPNGEQNVNVVSSEPPTALGIPQVVGVIDTDGQLKLKRQLHGAPLEQVRLVADNPMLGLPGPLLYRVTFSDVRFGRQKGSLSSFIFQAPPRDVEVDLIRAAAGAGAEGGLTNGGNGGGAGLNLSTLPTLATPQLETDILVVHSTGRGAEEVHRTSWSSFKARLAGWLETLEATWLGKTLVEPTISDDEGRSILEFEGLPNGTSHLLVRNGNRGPSLLVDGEDGNLYVSAKGASGSISFRAGVPATAGDIPKPAFVISSAAGAGVPVNFCYTSSRATGGSPVLGATGEDPVVGLDIVTKNGQVRIDSRPVVTTTDIQDISNKTISTSTLNAPAIDAPTITGLVRYSFPSTTVATTPVDINADVDHALGEGAALNAVRINAMVKAKNPTRDDNQYRILTLRSNVPGNTTGHTDRMFVYTSGDAWLWGELTTGADYRNPAAVMSSKKLVPPATSNAPGKRGQWAENGTDFFVYSESAGKWKKIAMEDF